MKFSQRWYRDLTDFSGISKNNSSTFYLDLFATISIGTTIISVINSMTADTAIIAVNNFLSVVFLLNDSI